MSDIDNDVKKQEELLKELEIQSILAESHELADREKMKKTAQKYRAKPKMDEIFSNASKKPRLTNSNPLDMDEEEHNENAIVGEKTAATMQAELIMDGSESSPEQASDESSDSTEDKSTDESETKKPASEEKPEEVVSLSPEYDEETTFSGEILGEVDSFRESPEIENINSIDIELDEKPSEEKPKPEETEKNEGRFEELFGKNDVAKPQKKIIAKVPVYRPEDNGNVINIKAGKFAEVVGAEYEEYIRSKNPSVIAHVIRPEPKKEPEEIDEEPKDERSAKEKILSALVGFFSKDESDDDDKPKEKVKTIEDYSDEDDESSIKYELNHNIRRVFIRSVIMGITALVTIILTIVTRLLPDSAVAAVPVAPAAYAVFNFLIIGFTLFLNRTAFLNGVTPLLRFKGNSDTAAAVAGATAVLQTVVSFFCLGDMSSFNVNYYVSVVLLAFFANNLGKLMLLLRVKDNFRFVTSKAPRSAAKVYNNESVAGQMLSGTASDKAIIAYQHQTDFPSNFLKISYAPDPSEDLASKLAPITTIAALVLAIIYGAVKFSFAGAVNTLALITALAIPISTLLAVNLPLKRICKTLTDFGAMLAGYPSVKQFCDTTAVMLDSNELFPADCIELEGIKTFDDYNVDESLLCGIAILKEAQNPLANAFDSVVTETKETLPEVESVLYEDDLGLVGWINGERILVGSRNLLEKYKVDTPGTDYEERYSERGSQITYLSRAGRLVAMLVTKYHADSELKSELQRAEANGISFLIRTTDYNITDDLIANLYTLFYRSIKVLPTGLGNVLKEAQSAHEESSRSYLITHGKPSSLARAVSAAIRIKGNISMAIIIQLIAVIPGILIAGTLSLYADISVMGSLEVLIYAAFWALATVVAPALQKP